MTAQIHPTALAGVLEVVSEPFRDARGSFLNAFRLEEWRAIWGERAIAQVNLSRSDVVGTIRGLHLQQPPHGEAKLVRCLRGRVWDVAVDLRAGSASRGCWAAVELSPQRGNALFIPEGHAHGFQVLEAGSELLYLHSGAYRPSAEGGVRWNDPELAIPWPLPNGIASVRDLNLPLLESHP
ncbi:MAG: dTDP-4-dehydrorhamnose 3,5-epimerase family protein [Prochlorococcaceae cyanobacterium]